MQEVDIGRDIGRGVGVHHDVTFGVQASVILFMFS